MSDREKGMSWLEGLAEPDWRECYSDSEVQETARQALDLIDALLKEQEAVEPYMDFDVDGHDVWRCGKCGATIFHIYHNASDEDAKNYAKFCRHCGQAVKWYCETMKRSEL